MWRKRVLYPIAAVVAVLLVGVGVGVIAPADQDKAFSQGDAAPDNNPYITESAGSWTRGNEGANEPGALDPVGEMYLSHDLHADDDDGDDGELHDHELEEMLDGRMAVTTVSSVVPLRVDSPYILGVTWPAVDQAIIEARVMFGDEWDHWQRIGVERTNGADGDTSAGTEPFIIGSAVALQVRVVTPGQPGDGIVMHLFSADQPATEVSLTQGELGSSRGFSLATELPVPQSLQTAIVNPQPTILLRSSWGAVAPSGVFDPGTVRGAAVHHTAGVNNYSSAQVPGILRAIQQYHMQGRGWFDIGYNFLVDRYGTIWEGRAGGITNTWKGVHSHSFNGAVTGVSVMGNFQEAGVPAAAVNSLVALLIWKFNLHGVDANGVLLHNGGVFPTILGHRDVPEASTACPGIHLHSLLPTIRARVAAGQGIPPYVFSQDVTGNGAHDILVTAGDTATVFVADPGSGGGPAGHVPFAGVEQLGVDMSLYWKHVGGPTLERGVGTDIFGKRKANGVLYRWSERGTGRIVSSNSYGVGWNRMSIVLTPGDLNRDGNADLLAVHGPTARLYFYAGDGKGGLGVAQQIGRGWSNMSNAAMVGDLNGDGVPDMVAVQRATGDLYFYPGTGTGAFGQFQKIGSGFSGFLEIAPAGDLNGDGVGDVLFHNPSTGETRTMVGSRTGLHGGFVTWDGGWGDWRDPVGAPGWGGAAGHVLIAVDQSSGQLVRPLKSAHSSGPTAAPTYSASPHSFTLPNLALAFIVGNVSGSSAADVVAVDTEGDAYLFVSTSSGFAAPVRIGTGLGQYEHIAPAGDSSFDGTPDLVVVDSAGNIVVIPMVRYPTPHLGEPRVIATGYAGARAYGVGAWSGANKADFIVIDSAGRAFHLIGRGLAGTTSKRQIASGWQTRIVVAGGRPSFTPAPSILTYEPGTGASSMWWSNSVGDLAGSVPVTINLDGGGLIGPNPVDILPPATDIPADGGVTDVAFYGQGHGHGIGLSQYGAQGQAQIGRTHAQILEFYFPGTTVSTRPNNELRVWIQEASTTEILLWAEPDMTFTAGATSGSLPTTQDSRTITAWRFTATGTGGMVASYLSAGSWYTTGFPVDLAATTSLTITGADGTVRFGAEGGFREFTGIGEIHLDPDSASTMRLVIQTPLEAYLRGVVPLAMPATWEAGALSAQAVVSRTYALYDAQEGGPPWYDTCSSSECQLFAGNATFDADGTLTEAYTHESTDAAIAATTGVVLEYSGHLAYTPYSESNGRQVAAGAFPYLSPKADPYDAYPAWSLAVPIEAIEAAYPSVGDVERIRVLRDGKGNFGGRVTTVIITGSTETLEVTGNNFRTTLGIKSALFNLSLGHNRAAGSSSRDLNNNRLSDLPTVAANGAVTVYLGDGVLLYYDTVVSGSGFGVFDHYALVSNFELVGGHGLFAVRGATMTYYRFTKSAIIQSGFTVPGNWGGYRSLTAIDDWDGIGTTALLAQEASTGNVVLFPGIGDGRLSHAQPVTSAWSHVDAIMAAGDIDGDGNPDLFTLDQSTGHLRLHYSTAPGQWAEGGTLVASDWLESSVNGWITSGDWNNDGKFDLIYRSPSSGRLYYRLGNGDGTFQPAQLLGRGYALHILLN
ncbi:MAG: hypothetical protein CVT64_02510 [Actinobacteria bacterium HGW-Actinobacteria-4]|nr:MAG: hypothetical protein CVT64_02510 [Actinobacteria bacterium HGW-Actinobacteria-4]